MILASAVVAVIGIALERSSGVVSRLEEEVHQQV
jgi:hypothetical protein